MQHVLKLKLGTTTGSKNYAVLPGDLVQLVYEVPKSALGNAFTAAKGLIEPWFNSMKDGRAAGVRRVWDISLAQASFFL